jgi:transposase
MLKSLILNTRCSGYLSNFAQQQRFGTSSESHEYQGELFNEAEVTVDEPVELTADTDVSVSPTQRAKRKLLPKDLPREVVIHDISDEDKQCDCCGHQLALMGQDSSEKLKFIPAQISVIEYVRLKYSCKHCETKGTKANIKQAAVPTSPIPKSVATPSLLSQLITSTIFYKSAVRIAAVPTRNLVQTAWY